MIEVRQLTKQYAATTALDAVSFSVRRGEIVGLLGPNGAGKTTAMRILSCFIPPTSGHARVAGHDVFTESRAVRRRLGYLPEGVPLYPDLRVDEYLRYRARIKDVPRRRLRAALDRVLADCGLVDMRRRVIGQLSKGYRQRVALADVLVHDPDVLILDEPTVGLDPEQIVEVRQLIRDLRGSRTVILSTHILSEVEMLCDRVLIIDRGRIAADEPTRALTERLFGGSAYLVRFAVSGEEPVAELAAVPDVEVVRSARTEDGLEVVLRSGVDPRPEIVRLAASHCWRVLELRPHAPSLEEVFVRLVRRSPERAATAPAPTGAAAAPAPVEQPGPDRRRGEAAAGAVASVPAPAAAGNAPPARVKMPALVGKELRSIFLSPIAYFVVTVFLVVTGIYFFMLLRAYNLPNPPQVPPMQHIFGGFFYWIGFLVIVPAMTMRLLSEEIKGGTIETLTTAPVSDLQVVLSKFLATLAFFVAMWSPTLLYVAFLYSAGAPDPGPIAAGYLGTLLLGAVFISIGLLASSLARDQVVAAVLAFVFSMGILSAGFVQRYVQRPELEELLGYISFFTHAADFARGIVDTRHVVYYLTLCAFFLFLTVRSVESRKWR